MRIKADWTTYLHDLRRREMDVVFRHCPAKVFPRVLELGAGDGFVSTILAQYANKLISTDMNAERLNMADRDNITFQICDAENLADVFKEQRFDMIFSSSLLEHLPGCDRALAQMYQALTDEGISIHYLPNRYWKLTTILLHIPNKLAVLIDKAAAGRLFKRRKGHKWFRPCKEKFGGNNMKVGRRKQFFLAKPFLPRIHGVSNNTISEFIAFGRKRWIGKFEAAGFDVLAVKKVAFNSGYGFGFPRIRNFAEYLGIKTAYAYIMQKQNSASGYAVYFMK